MKIFTWEKLQTAEQTLNLIRQLAHTYRVINVNNEQESLCLN